MMLLFFSTPPHKHLLGSAATLLKDNHPAAAVVTAQAACEVFAEQVITALFRAKNVEFLSKPIDAFITGGYSLKNEKIRDLYRALTEDDIVQQAFWPDYCKMVKLRNDFVHDGQSISPEDATKACDAAAKFTDHLSGVLDAIVKAAKPDA